MIKSTNFNFLKNAQATRTYPAGQLIFSAGQVGEDMYYIKSGQVDITLTDKLAITLNAGEVFGEMAIIDSHIRCAYATAKTECELVTINEKEFSFLVHQHPYFALNIMKILAERLRNDNMFGAVTLTCAGMSVA